MNINFTAESSGQLPQGNLIKAVSKALRATMKAAKKDAADAIKARYIKPSIGTKALKYSVRGLTAELKSAGARNPLEKFKISPKKRKNPAPKSGVFAQVLKNGGGYIQKGFIQSNGGVYERTTAKRFPLRRFKSVSAPGMLKPTPIISKILSQLEKNMSTNLQKEIGAMF